MPGSGIETTKDTKITKIGILVSACARFALLSFATFVSFVVKNTVCVVDNIHHPAAVRA
jgi:hypothetical protein